MDPEDALFHGSPGGAMSSIVKVIEIIAQSEKSWDDAAQMAVGEAAKTVKNIKSVWVDNFSGECENNRIVRYRANVKISFLVEGR
jgi:flavin-binding protein dodecin